MRRACSDDLIQRPDFFAEHERARSLSEALRSVRLSGAIFLHAEFTAPWGFAAPPASAGARLLAPTAEHMILFHLLVEGEASVRIPGQGRVALEAGDIAVLPGGAAHELWNGRVTQLIDSSELLPKLLTGAVLSGARRRRRPHHQVHLRLHRLRAPGAAAVSRGAAASVQGEHPPRCIGRVARRHHPPPRIGARAGPRRAPRAACDARRGIVHRDPAPVHGRPPTAANRMARRRARSGSGTRARCDPPRARAPLDRRVACRTRRNVTHRFRGAVYPAAWRGAAHLCRPLPHAARRAAARDDR